jgi:tRNA dimethylallyltransferase
MKIKKTKNSKKEDCCQKIVLVLGPTSSGKTGLGVRLADKFDGEIVSADSRQVYKGMDIGTGKDLPEYEIKKINKTKKIKYHLIDVASPKSEYSLAKYQKMAQLAIKDIIQRGKLPVVVGGSGLHLQSLFDDYQLSDIGPDKELRAKLEKKTVKQLFDKLLVINKNFAKKLNNSEKNNKRRLIRYLEILGKEKTWRPKTKKSVYNFLFLGLDLPKEKLEERIKKRLDDRLEEGLIDEVKRLHREGVSWKRLERLGLEYRFVSFYLQDKMDYETMTEKLFIAIRQFAKKQRSWSRRLEKQGKKINWVKSKKEAEELVRKFLK